jgi:hypothetical protein
MKNIFVQSVVADARGDNELILYLVKRGAGGTEWPDYRGFSNWTIPEDLAISRKS